VVGEFRAMRGINHKAGRLTKLILFVILFHLGGTCMAIGGTRPRHIVLIGASVGKAWNISELPKRIKNSDYSFEYVGMYQFDKSSALNQVVSRSKNKPDAIILKECAAYFPSDISFEEAKSLMKQWVNRCQATNIVPIPTTIAPVTPSNDERFKTHNPVKRIIKRMLGISMMTRIERIIEYNDWVKAFSKEKNLIVLDLETPLRIDDGNRFLRDDLTKGDGLHLNAEGYRILDSIVIPTLDRVRFPK